MEIIVAVLVAQIELISDSLNLGNRKTPEMSEAVIFINMAAKGQITVTIRNIPNSSLTGARDRTALKAALISFPLARLSPVSQV
jgi:hypothetical protein